MKTEQIAAILYTVRNYVTTADDLRRTLEKLAGIGYRAIQVSGVPLEVMPPEQIAAACRDLGLTICATHENPDWYFNHPQRVVERLQALGTNLTAYPFPAGEDLASPAGVDAFLDRLTAATETLANYGITLCYHNHNDEFARVGGKTIFERIYDETPIQAEPDTYWIQAGGASPLEWVTRLASRSPLLHLKDMAIVLPREQRYAEIGLGNIDFPPIINAATDGGCQWYIVEQDECYERDPFASLELSFQYLRSLAE